MEAWLMPMLCGKADAPPADGDWILEPKLDGWRYMVWSTGRVVQTFAGRNGSSYTGKLPYIEDAVRELVSGRELALDGELLGTNGWGDVQGIMTRGDGPHVPNQHVPALSYVIFDVLRYDDEDFRAKPWHERRAFLEHVFQAVDGAPDHLLMSLVHDCTDEQHAAHLALGVEGSVAKQRQSVYTNGRSQAWKKIKPQDTLDSTIVGFQEGKPGTQFEGALGAFEVELPSGTRTTVGSGLRAVDRVQYWRMRDELLGRIIEVAHHGEQEDTGKVRHPVFIRLREDR